MNRAIIYVLTSVLIIHIRLTFGLNCYKCSKIDNLGPDMNCTAQIIKPDPEECKASGTGVPMCFRTTATIKVNNKDFNYVVRGCFEGTNTSSQACVDQPFEHPGFNVNVTSQYCTCKTNECNGNGNPFPPASGAPKIIPAHFILPIIGFALRQAQALL